MMLRASIETDGSGADLRGVTDTAGIEDSSISSAAALVGLVDATLSGDAAAVQSAGGRVRRELGPEAWIDAAAIIGNFERMTRIADGTGIPLDTPVQVASESLAIDLGIDRFATAGNSHALKGWQRTIGRALAPLVRVGLRWMGRRARSRSTPQEPMKP